MKSEPWIDKLYQQSLTSREIPLDLNHWTQAEAMIIAREKLERKRRVILWSLIFGLGIGIATFSWNQYIHSKNKEPKSLSPSVPDLKIPVVQPEVANIKTPNPDLNKPVTGLSETTASLDKVNHGEKHIPLINNKLLTKELEHSRTVLNTYQNKSNESENIIAIQQNPVPEINTNPLVQNESSESRKIEYLELSVLTKNWNVSSLNQQKSLSLPILEISEEPIRIKTPAWKEHGIRMTLAQDAGLQFGDPSISNAGFEWYRQKSIGSKWFYGYSLGYKSNFNREHYAQVITAFQFDGFSADVQNFGIKPEWMSALYAQGNMGFGVKKHRLLLGLRPEFIIGAKGKVEKLLFKEATGIRDIAKAEVSSVNDGWLETGSLNNLSWNLSIGYEFRIAKKLGIGIQMDHTLISVYRPLGPDIKQQAAAAWNTGFRFSYILN